MPIDNNKFIAQSMTENKSGQQQQKTYFLRTYLDICALNK